MITRVSSHQPPLFPWAGYWNKYAKSDVAIVTCGVPYARDSYMNRVAVLGSTLTLPLEGGARSKLIKHVQYKKDELPKLFRTFRQMLAGKKWPGKWAVEQILYDSEQEELKNRYHSLMDLNIDSLLATAKQLGLLGRPDYAIDTEESDPAMSKTERLVARVRRHVPEGRIQYLAGSGALGYIEVDRLPADFEFLVQKPKEGAPPESVLQLIAQNDVAEAMSDRWFEWTPISPRRGAES